MREISVPLSVVSVISVVHIFPAQDAVLGFRVLWTPYLILGIRYGLPLTSRPILGRPIIREARDDA